MISLWIAFVITAMVTILIAATLTLNYLFGAAGTFIIILSVVWIYLAWRACKSG